MKSKVKVTNPIEKKIIPKSLIVTESSGFLNAGVYSESDILHIGISDSKGNIYNFWDSYKIDD